MKRYIQPPEREPKESLLQAMAGNASQDTMGKFGGLPPQILESIVESLPTKEVVKLGLVCKSFQEICQQEALWKRKWLAGYHKEASFQACSKGIQSKVNVTVCTLNMHLKCMYMQDNVSNGFRTSTSTASSTIPSCTIICQKNR